MKIDGNPTIQRSWRKTVTLHISPNGSLLIKAPYLVPRHTIDQFVKKHEAWIVRKRAELKTHVLSKKFVCQPGSTVLFMGIAREITVGTFTTIKAVENKLQFPDYLQFRMKEEMLSWYKREATRSITTTVDEMAQEMKTNYLSLTFSDTKSKWGSCTHDNRLQINWRLVMAPALVIRYVVIHELAHTVIKNHSQAFWTLVERYTPSYKQQRRWLKTNGETLHWNLS
jgi:hypothetical protein